MRVPTALSAAGFIAIVPGSIGGWIPLYISTRGASPPRWTPDRVAGVALVVIGWTILLWCTIDSFDEASVRRRRAGRRPSSF